MTTDIAHGTTMENGTSAGVILKQKASPAVPPIPHVEMNQLPLSLLLRNLTVFAAKEISQFFKLNVHTGQKTPFEKKLELLNMILYLRNQFLKVYVLVKWAKTLKQNNFHSLIDLLDWFRNANMQVNNCTIAMKQILGTMAGAKLPNPDLVTSLEVLMLGRPNLPTHGFNLNGKESTSLTIPSKLILKRLRDLNICLSIKILLINVPSQLSTYEIKDGRIIFRVKDEFELQLSTIDQNSPLFFVNVKLLFNERLPLNLPKLEKHINEILFKSTNPLYLVYQFLHKYTLTLQMYMIHVELNALELNGKYSGGHLVHSYDSKRQIITIKYWLQSKIANTCKCVIGMDKETESIVLEWQNNDVNKEAVNTRYHGLLNNIESIIDEITFNHAQMIRSDLLRTETFQEDDEDATSTSLLFQIPTTCALVSQIQLKIDQVSGIFYFHNPSNLLLSYARQINQSSNTQDLIIVLGKLKLDKVDSILRHMLDKTGWICSDVVKLKSSIVPSSESTFSKDIFVKLKDWPSNWFLVLTVISSTNTCIVEKRIGKIISVKGVWELKYMDRENVITSKLDSMTYPKMLTLQKSILNKIVNHMIMDSLNELKIKNKICTFAEEENNVLPPYIIRRDGKESIDNITIIALGLESFLEGSTALNTILESSMLLKIHYQKMDIELYGKFKTDNQMIRCQCDELSINFLEEDSLSFFMSENFGNLNDIMLYLSKFRKKLMQLIALTNVMDTLHSNFQSADFRVIELRPNEIRFKYLPLKDSPDTEDCVIKIVTNQEKVEKLDIKLSEHNPQIMIQKFLDEKEGFAHNFVFNYLQFTLPLFRASKESEAMSLAPNDVKVHLFMHSLQEFHLLYRNHKAGGEISFTIQLKSVVRTRHDENTQYFIRFAKDYSQQQQQHPLSKAIMEIQKSAFSLTLLKDQNSDDGTSGAGIIDATASQNLLTLQDHKNTDTVSDWSTINFVRLGSALACSHDQILPILLQFYKSISKC
ncbi:unnamed protein product [Kluyveromyces dobzhanskii CBS 2104]|uniref:Mediator of RNA polymerase II transcription subunit 14 n=1 Tax=Kluyveromyces dobzhanskii CBS 2104 TaxID=1427455 RepID=A0A0A8L1Z4_9SACH|nr:unnamed protein product [Kluyveromyces dobzhanskii CBS 2104]